MAQQQSQFRFPGGSVPLWAGAGTGIGVGPNGALSRDIVLEVVLPEVLLAGVREDLLRLELSAGGALFSGVFSRVLLLWCHSVGTLPVGDPMAEELLVHRGIRVARRMVDYAVAVPLSDGLDPIERRALRDARVLASFLLGLTSCGAQIGRFEIGLVDAGRCGRFQSGTLPPIRHPLSTSEVLFARVLACWEANRSKGFKGATRLDGAFFFRGSSVSNISSASNVSPEALIARRLPPSAATPPAVWGRALLERFLRAPSVRDILARTPWGSLESLRGRFGGCFGGRFGGHFGEGQAQTRGFPGILETLLEGIPAAAAGLPEAEGYEATALERALDRVRAALFVESQTNRAAMGFQGLSISGGLGAEAAPDTARLLTRMLLKLVIDGAIDVLDAHSESAIERKRFVDAAANESVDDRRDCRESDATNEAHAREARYDTLNTANSYAEEPRPKNRYTVTRPRLWFAADAVLLEWPQAATVLLKAWGQRMGEMPEIEDCSELITYLAQEGALDERLPARALPIVLDDEKMAKHQKAELKAQRKAQKEAQRGAQRAQREATDEGDTADEDHGTQSSFAIALRPTVALFAAGTVAVQKTVAAQTERARAFEESSRSLRSSGKKKTKTAAATGEGTQKKHTIERLHRSLLMPGILPLANGGIGVDAEDRAGSTASDEDARSALYLPSYMRPYHKKTVTRFAWRLTVPGKRAAMGRKGRKGPTANPEQKTPQTQQEKQQEMQQEAQRHYRVRRVLALFEAALNTEAVPEDLALFGNKGVFLSVESMERALLSSVSDRMDRTAEGLSVRPGRFLLDPKRLLESAAAALADWGVLIAGPQERASSNGHPNGAVIPSGSLVLLAPKATKATQAKKATQASHEQQSKAHFNESNDIVAREAGNEDPGTRAQLGVVIAPWCVRPVRVTRFVMDDISRKNVTNGATVWNEEDVPWPSGTWDWVCPKHIGAG